MDLILKLFLTGLTVAAAIVGIKLNTPDEAEKRKQSKIIRAMIVVIVLSGLTTALINIRDNKNSSNKDEQLMTILEEQQNLKQLIEPLQKIAQKRFPEKGPDAALKEIIQGVTKKFYGFYGSKRPRNVTYTSNKDGTITFYWNCKYPPKTMKYFYWFCTTCDDNTSHGFPVKEDSYTMKVKPGQLYAWSVQCDNSIRGSSTPLYLAMHNVEFESILSILDWR